MLGIILGSTPGFVHAGETHWLTKARNSAGQWQSIAALDVPPVKWPVACRVCGRNCEVFSEDFRRQLATDEADWYAKIANRLAADTLVSGDKNFNIYSKKIVGNHFDLLVVYKSRHEYFRSVMKQFILRSKTTPGMKIPDPGRELDRWVSNYQGHLCNLHPSGKRIVLNWERFVSEPEFHMARLGDLLDPRITPVQLRAIRLGHFIGGNTGVDVSELQRRPIVSLHPSDAPPLTDEQAAAVASHDSARGIEQVLDAEYARQFARP